jgi:hypothetical protein
MEDFESSPPTKRSKTIDFGEKEALKSKKNNKLKPNRSSKLSEYELKRLENIKRNEELLASLGVVHITSQIAEVSSAREW